MKQEDLLKKLREHKPIIVNYGKGSNGKEIKELATWNEEKQKYCSEDGIWGTGLLVEIAKGEVENTTLEVYDVGNVY